MNQYRKATNEVCNIFATTKICYFEIQMTVLEVRLKYSPKPFLLHKPKVHGSKKFKMFL